MTVPGSGLVPDQYPLPPDGAAVVVEPAEVPDAAVDTLATKNMATPFPVTWPGDESDKKV